MQETKIILASSSPRRKRILEKMGLSFEIIPSKFEENLESSDFTYQKIENLAYNKGLAVAQTIKTPSIILSADTVVVLNNKILGKPKNKQDAFTMLSNLSGEKHSVVTSVCAINLEKKSKNILSETSYVEFENIDDSSIISYIELYKPYDKAGSYGIQELPKYFIKNIDGDIENIIGLSSNIIKRVL